MRTASFLLLAASTCSAARLTHTARAASLVVDNQSPRASDTNAGTRDSPFKTINAAAQKLKPGDEVLVRPGTYREAVTLRVSGTQQNPVTLRSEVPHAAIIDGADVVAPAQIRAEAGGAYSFTAPTIQSNPYWDDHSFGEWVYIGGEPLERVEERGKLAPMCFFEDYAAKRIIFRGTEDFQVRNAAVEFATRDGLMAPEHRDINTVQSLDDVRIIGFTLQHNADWFGARKAINFRGRRWLIEDNVVRWSSWGGIMAQSSNNCTVRGNTVQWCGDTGISGSANANLLVEGNRVTHMNWRRINPSFDGGFGKFQLSIDCRFQGNESAYQFGFGPWLDIHNIGNTLQGNISHDSIGGEGLFCEISSDNTLLDNVAYNIAGGAITIGESSGCVAQRNIAFNSGYGLRLRGDGTRENDHALVEGGKTSNFSLGESKFVAAVSEIPDLSPQRRDEYASKYLLLWAAPRAFMSSNNLWWQNISFGNGANYLEERDYSKPSAAVNNLSDYNFFFPDNRLESPSGKHQDLADWRKVSNRDEHSQVLDPMSAGARLPDWAESKRALWSQKMRTRDEVGALNLSLIDSPSAADCRARFFRSERATRIKVADASVQAWILDVEGQRTLAVWTTQLGQRRAMRLRVGADAVTFESPYNAQSRRTLTNQAIEIVATHLPIYLRGVGADIAEAPLATLRAQSFSAPGATISASATFANETAAPQKIMASFQSEGFTIAPARLSRTLAAGQTITVPLTLRPGAKAARGTSQLTMQARLGEATAHRSATFVVGEGGGLIPASRSEIAVDGKPGSWKPLGDTALLGSISDAGQISGGSPSTWSGPKDASAQMHAAWTKDALYVLAQVTDDVVIPADAGAAPWDSDAVEVFVDGRDAAFQYIKEPTAGVFQISVSPGANAAAPRVQVLAKTELQGLETASTRTANGYSITLKIPLSPSNFPGAFESGRPLRMSMLLNDRDDASRPRENVLGWSASPGGRNYEDTTGWKTLTLGH